MGRVYYRTEKIARPTESTIRSSPPERGKIVNDLKDGVLVVYWSESGKPIFTPDFTLVTYANNARAIPP